MTRTGTLKAESSVGSEDDMGRSARARDEFIARPDNFDNIFMEDVSVFKQSNIEMLISYRSFRRYHTTSERAW